ncbi:hypothetical protein BDY24DRAFT_416153 [Mrakia frigida]|uniref:uncharacterized protein n=1 Tax=Mrakia frigida TaxID=29902 RepID=UPI003FCC1119
MLLLPSHLLEGTLSTFEVLRSIFPLPGELDIPPESTTTLLLLRSHLDSSSSTSPSSSSSITLPYLTARIQIALDPPPGSVLPDEDEDGWNIVVKVVLAISKDHEGEDDVELPSTSITLLQPSWISDRSFQGLKSNLPLSSSASPEEDPTSRILELAEHLRIVGPKLIPLASAPSSSPQPLIHLPLSVESHSMSIGKEAILCLSKMHHIVNQPKLRKLKALAVENGASGFVKAGKPGVMLYELSSPEVLHRFLMGVRSLNYLEFHHLASTPLLPPPPSLSGSSPPSISNSPKHTTSSTASRRKTAKGGADGSGEGMKRLNEGKVGLVEITEMKEMTIDVHFHVVQRSTSRAGGGVKLPQIDSQLDVLNQGYASSGFAFNLVSVDYTKNVDWFELSDVEGPGRDYQTAMKRALRKGTAKDLNIFVVGFSKSDNIGYSTFPWNYTSDPLDDGVVLNFDTLPGGYKKNYDHGRTAVHEVGHWLGLFHPFQGGCNGNGDLVDDTPRNATRGQDTCSQPGHDSIHNFMDYSYDR